MASKPRIEPVVYVGRWGHQPPAVKELPRHLRRLHPRELPDMLEHAWPKRFWSNNPYVIDLFPAERVMVCYRGVCRPLSDHPNWPRWKDEFAAGEFWAMHGEEWVTAKAQEPAEP